MTDRLCNGKGVLVSDKIGTCGCKGCIVVRCGFSGTLVGCVLDTSLVEKGKDGICGANGDALFLSCMN